MPQPELQMTLQLFYTQASMIDVERSSAVLSGDEARHASRSLRMRKGEEIAVGDGEGSIYTVVLEEVRKGWVRGAITGACFIEREQPEIVLCQALGRPSRMDGLISLAAEAGISEVRPFISSRSEAASRQTAADRLARWRRIALEASKVARRARPLTLSDVFDPDSSADTFRHLDSCVLLWEDEHACALRETLPEAPRSLGLIVGPEGGFSEEEVRLFRGAGAETAHMGGLIMRSESAGAYAAMIVRYHYGLLDAPGGHALG